MKRCKNKKMLDPQNSMENEEKKIPQCQNSIGEIPALLLSSKTASIFSFN
jgi:hypothetical protein